MNFADLPGQLHGAFVRIIYHAGKIDVHVRGRVYRLLKLYIEVVQTSAGWTRRIDIESISSFEVIARPLVCLPRLDRAYVWRVNYFDETMGILKEVTGKIHPLWRSYVTVLPPGEPGISILADHIVQIERLLEGHDGQEANSSSSESIRGDLRGEKGQEGITGYPSPHDRKNGGDFA